MQGENIISIFPGKPSQGSSRQFVSGEGNHTAFPWQKTMHRSKPSQLLGEPQHCPLVSGAIHHCNEDTKHINSENMKPRTTTQLNSALNYLRSLSGLPQSTPS